MQSSSIHDAAKKGDVSALASHFLHQDDHHHSMMTINQGRAKDGRSALVIAAMYDQMESTQWLLKHGADVNDHKNESSMTPLYWACARGSPALVKLLLANGADPCITTSAATTPLHRAAWRGNMEIVASLLDHSHQEDDESNLLVDARDEHGETALYKAVSRRHADVARLLIEGGGADPTVSNCLKKHHHHHHHHPKHKRISSIINETHHHHHHDDDDAPFRVQAAAAAAGLGARKRRTAATVGGPTMTAWEVAKNGGDQACTKVIEVCIGRQAGR